MKPENLPFGKGQSSSKPPFMASMLVFGGVLPSAKFLEHGESATLKQKLLNTEANRASCNF